jgi:hypothetical protein
MLKLVMMPPQNDLQRQWAARLQRGVQPAWHLLRPQRLAGRCAMSSIKPCGTEASSNYRSSARETPCVIDS